MSGTKLAESDTMDVSLDLHRHCSDEDLKGAQKPPVFRSKMFLIAITFSSIIMIAMISSFIWYYLFDGNGNGKVADPERDDMFSHLPAEQRAWFEEASDELKLALSRQLNNRKAKNVIIFVGDGMGPNSVTASRIMNSGEGGRLVWESFPDMGLLKVSLIVVKCQALFKISCLHALHELQSI